MAIGVPSARAWVRSRTLARRDRATSVYTVNFFIPTDEYSAANTTHDRERNQGDQ